MTYKINLQKNQLKKLNVTIKLVCLSEAENKFPFREPVYEIPKCSAKLRDFKSNLPVKLNQCLLFQAIPQ